MGRALLSLLLATMLFVTPPGAVAQSLGDTLSAMKDGKLATLKFEEGKEPSHLEVGDAFEMTLTVPEGGEFEKIEFAPTKDQKGILRVEQILPQGDGKFAVRGHVLRAGKHTMGMVEFKATRKGSAQPEKIGAFSPPLNVIAPDGQFDPEKIASAYSDPKEVPFDTFWRNLILSLAAILGIALLAALVYWIQKMLKRRLALRPPAPPVPPIEVALRDVRVLKALDTYVQHGPERHYTLLSNILRRYVEEQFETHALEMTEDEVVALLQHDLAHLRSVADVVQALRRGSLAKYARQSLTREVALTDCESVEAFLLAERDRLERERAVAAAASGERRAA